MTKVKCVICGETIQSKHRHDFVECSCGNIFVDGGNDYLRMGFKKEGSYEMVEEKYELERDVGRATQS